MRVLLPLLILLSLLPVATTQAATPLRIALAANLLPAMEPLIDEYQRHSGNEVQIASGSSGVFYEQIRRGAPFDLFFSADAERPDLLAAAGIGSHPRTYACGRLALWVPRGAADLSSLPAGRIAIAHPDTAPYGQAALEALEHSGQLQSVEPRLVYAQNVGQAYQFTLSGNASAGFVGLSQLRPAGVPAEQFVLIDPTLYAPLVQKRLLLAKGDRRHAAEDFLAWLEQHQQRLSEAGYILPGEPGCAD